MLGFNNKEKEVHTVKQYEVRFTDNNSLIHTGPTYNYIDPNSLNVDAQEYIMNSIKLDGYVQDTKTKIFYPWHSIQRLWFDCVNIQHIEPIYNVYDDMGWKVWYSSKEVEERCM